MEKKYFALILIVVFFFGYLIGCFTCCLGGAITSFEVTVNDNSGSGIPNADVEITDSDGDTILSDTADSNGILDVDDLKFESGEDYTITADDEDFNEETKTGINFDENTDNDYTFSLQEDKPKPPLNNNQLR